MVAFFITVGFLLYYTGNKSAHLYTLPVTGTLELPPKRDVSSSPNRVFIRAVPFHGDFPPTFEMVHEHISEDLGVRILRNSVRGTLTSDFLRSAAHEGAGLLTPPGTSFPGPPPSVYPLPSSPDYS